MKTHSKHKMNKKISKRTRKKKIVGGNKSTSSGGIFCYMPYSSLDTHNKSTFKIESATNIREQLKYLKKFFPSGFYVISILKTPSVGSKTIKSRKIYYQLIKENIIEFTINDGGVTENKPIEDGWVYCSIDNIHNAFNKAEKKYGGELQEFGMTGRVNDTMELIDVKNTKNPVYVGKIIFHT
jgi:hypothetical protein